MTAEEARARLRQQADQLRQQVETRAARQQREAASPPAYLYTAAGQWRVIVAGIPMAADRPTAEAARAAAERLGAVIAPHYWDSDRLQWNTIERETA
jgi:5-formyltetrahydrofolate cyclo-ligase